jgi:hypothetical protein
MILKKKKKQKKKRYYLAGEFDRNKTIGRHSDQILNEK